jgi:hypothetical protein
MNKDLQLSLLYVGSKQRLMIITCAARLVEVIGMRAVRLIIVMLSSKHKKASKS